METRRLGRRPTPRPGPGACVSGAAVLGLFLSILALLVVIIQLDVDRTTLLSIVPSAHSDIANWLVVLVGIAGGIALTVGVAVVGFVMVRGK